MVVLASIQLPEVEIQWVSVVFGSPAKLMPLHLGFDFRNACTKSYIALPEWAQFFSFHEEASMSEKIHRPMEGFWRPYVVVIWMTLLVLLVGGTPAAAQGVVFTGSGQLNPVAASTPTGIPITPGEITLAALSAGVVMTGSTITILFQTPIISAGSAICQRVGLPNCNIAISSSASRLVITFTETVAFDPLAGSITISGVVLNNLGMGTTKIIFALFSSTSPEPLTNAITFSPVFVPVALSCADCP